MCHHLETEEDLTKAEIEALHEEIESQEKESDEPIQAAA